MRIEYCTALTSANKLNPIVTLFESFRMLPLLLLAHLHLPVLRLKEKCILSLNFRVPSNARCFCDRRFFCTPVRRCKGHSPPALSYNGQALACSVDVRSTTAFDYTKPALSSTVPVLLSMAKSLIIRAKLMWESRLAWMRDSTSLITHRPHTTDGF